MLKSLLVTGLTLCACGSIDDENNGIITPEFSVIEQGLHPSGVCRIKGHTSWAEKVVEYYHISAPYTVWFEYDCDIWVGTSDCCAQNPYFPLSYDECVQLRHQPDCPGGGGGPGSENEDDDGPL